MWSNLPDLAAQDNLIYKVANHLTQLCKPESGVEIWLEKRIPLAAGLGGGSSDAASAIIALNELWDLNLSPSEMQDIAALFGSDISFFLHGGTAWGTHRGELLSLCSDFGIDNILLVNPQIKIPAAQAYQLVALPDPGSRRSFRPDAWRDSCFNRLEAGIRSRYTEVDELIRQLEHLGARPALMSGSGSTCFGIFDNAAELKACQQCFNQTGYWTQVVRTLTRIEYQSVFKA